MRLWVPDIGDKIVLTADWTFAVINEGRNGAIWQALGLETHPSTIAMRQLAAEKLAAAQDFERKHRTKESTTGWGYRRLDFHTDSQEEEAAALWAAYQAVRDPSVEVTFPKDTQLTIDRVYIRKGASEFSSITFFIGDSPMKELMPVKKGGRWPGGQRRFFARLADVNKIECDIIS